MMHLLSACCLVLVVFSICPNWPGGKSTLRLSRFVHSEEHRSRFGSAEGPVGTRSHTAPRGSGHLTDGRARSNGLPWWIPDEVHGTQQDGTSDMRMASLLNSIVVGPA